MLGTERHESRRIDNQLRGRSGRQGDPGETRFYLSAQDEVVRLFAGDRMYKILDRLGPTDGEPIEAKMLTNQIERAQKKVEEFHFVNRKNVVKYDDVLNDQRTQVYARRRQILEGEDLRESVLGWIEDVIEAVVDAHMDAELAEEADWDGMRAALNSIYPVRLDLDALDRSQVSREDLLDLVYDDAVALYEEREAAWAEMDENLPRNVERWIILQVMDTRWREHLDNMDYFRQGVGLQGYAQKDPLVVYRTEGTLMFEEMNGLIMQEAVRGLMHAEVEVDQAQQFEQQQQPDQGLEYLHADAQTLEAIAAGYDPSAEDEAEEYSPPIVEQRQLDPEKTVGRNDPCWCGSGKKYKRCHGA